MVEILWCFLWVITAENCQLYTKKYSQQQHFSYPLVWQKQANLLDTTDPSFIFSVTLWTQEFNSIFCFICNNVINHIIESQIGWPILTNIKHRQDLILATDLLFESVEADAALEYFTHHADWAVRVSSTEDFLDVGGDISLNVL